MDSLDLIKLGVKILAGRILMTNTKPLKASPLLLDRVAEMPMVLFVTSWYANFNWN